MSGFSAKDTKTYINGHTILIVFAVIFLIIAFLGLIALSGAQTGSSNTSGIGSLVISSTNGDPDGTVNPTTEVVGEFLIVVLIVLGVAMLTYALTMRKSVGHLLEKKQVYAALIIDGNKKVDEKDIKEIEGEQLDYLLGDLGLPKNTISAGLDSIKTNAGVAGNYANQAYTAAQNAAGNYANQAYNAAQKAAGNYTNYAYNAAKTAFNPAGQYPVPIPGSIP